MLKFEKNSVAKRLIYHQSSVYIRGELRPRGEPSRDEEVETGGLAASAVRMSAQSSSDRH